MEWVANATKISGRPSVASLGLYSDYVPAANEAAANLVAAGVTTVVASGDSVQDVKYLSPASEPTVITVAASNITDCREMFSNKGAGVDIHAPGM